MTTANGTNELVKAVKKQHILSDEVYGQAWASRPNGEQPKQFQDKLEAMRWVMSVFDGRRA